MTYGSYALFPLQFLIKIIDMTCESYGPFQLQFLITIIEIWAMAAMGHFLYNSLANSLKYDLRQLWAISITTPYQNHWNMTYDYYGPFSLQFLIKIIEMWPMTAICNCHYNSLSKSLNNILNYNDFAYFGYQILWFTKFFGYIWYQVLWITMVLHTLDTKCCDLQWFSHPPIPIVS